MGKTKKYSNYYYDDDENEKYISILAKEVLNDPERENITDIIVGCWEEAFEESCQEILDMFVENSEKFQHVESLYIGDMDYEECEVSWIQQGNYEGVLNSLKNLKHLKIKGSENLSLGNIDNDKLESIEIICGGLPKNIFEELIKAKLPKLKKLNLYIGVENYGFNGGIETVKEFLKNYKFENLEYLGLGNSEIQNEVIEEVLKSDVVSKLKVLDFSNGNTNDEGAKIIIENFDKIKHLEFLNLKYNYISDEYASKLEELAIKIDVSDRNKRDYKWGDYPMLTE